MIMMIAQVSAHHGKAAAIFFQNGWPLGSVLQTLQTMNSHQWQLVSSSLMFPLPFRFLFFPLSCTLTLQHLELVIEAVDGAEAELPGLLVLVVEAVEAERGGDIVALRSKRG